MQETYETWIQSLGWEIPWRSAWQSTLLFLPGESHGQRSLAVSIHRIEKTQIWLKQLSRHPWAVAHQALLFMRFPRQEYCSELPFYSLGDLPDQRSNPSLLHLAGKFFITGSPDFQALINNWGKKKKKPHLWWWINYKTQVLFDWVILKIRYLESSEKQQEGEIQNLYWTFLKFCFKKLLNLCKSRRYSKSPGNPSIGDLAPTIINIVSCYFPIVHPSLKWTLTNEQLLKAALPSPI